MAVAILNTVCAAVVCDSIILLEPNIIERVLALFELNIPVVKLYPLRFNSPLVNVVVSVTPVLKALPKLHPPPTPSNVIEPFIVVPFVVIVLPVVVELNVIVPVLVQTVPATNDIDPDIARVGVVPVANVTVPADTVMFRQANAPVIVTV